MGMNKLKQRFAELRKNTPKRVQWLLLGAAFIVVLILLTLLLTNGNDQETISTDDAVPLELIVSPDTIDWADVIVGQSKKQSIKVSASAPVRVTDITIEKNIDGLRVNHGCKGAGEINQKFACAITVEYTPTKPMMVTGAPIVIKWRGAQQPDTMINNYKYNIILGAKAPEKKPEPVSEPEKVKEIPEKKTVEKTISEPEPSSYSDTKEESFDFFEEETVQDFYEPEAEPEPKVDLIAPKNTFVATEKKKEYKRPSEQCSDFAFPGYNQNGNQIGWIKPSGGTYYFHPFSDKNCENATGIYNPNTGAIVDINNPSKKIGTDADHMGYSVISDGILPELTSRPKAKSAESEEAPMESSGMGRLTADGFKDDFIGLKDATKPDVEYTSSGDAVVSSKIHDRQFLLRQYKPIPATIVSEVRADASALEIGVPVRATVDRNVYSDSGRNVIIPTGTLMLGYVSGNLPGPYQTVGRMNINWYQFILPNGVEFNFEGDAGSDPFSADSQGRVGVPGYGSSDYLEQFFMPMLTAIVPAAVNLIAPVTDAFVNQIDLDNNTVVQSGTVRSSEMAKNQIITAWNQVAQKLIVDTMDNTVPPFTIAAGTRINVYSPKDLMVTCGAPGTSDKKCAVAEYGTERRPTWKHSTETDVSDGSWVGQARSFDMKQYCVLNNGVWTIDKDRALTADHDYRTVLFYCQSLNYQAKNMAKQEQVWANQQDSSNKNSITYVKEQGQQAYNEQVLGLTYDEETGAIENPFKKPEPIIEEAINAGVVTCDGGIMPDANGCCPGETYTDMGEAGFNCCPDAGGDCFPPIEN